MRPREAGTFLPGRDPKVMLDSGEKLKVEGPCPWLEQGQRVSCWTVTDYTQAITRKYAHSVEAV